MICPDENGQSGQNEARTDRKIDTPVTRPGSPFDPALVHDLKAMRARHGAESAEGHRCSNLLELIENYGKAIDEAHKARIEERIRWQMRSLAGICAMPTQERG